MTKEEFSTLYNIDCSKHIERKETGSGYGLSYLSWAYAWANFKIVHPDATYDVVKFDGLPYICDSALGIIVYTNVTAAGVTHEMWLPVMDASNKAMKLEPYSYKAYDKEKRQYVEKWVKAADMFDINKTIMRCLTKNLAMFGLGLSIYAGEDIPQPLSAEEEQAIAEEVKSRAAKSAPAPKQAPKPAAKPAGKPLARKDYSTLTPELYGKWVEAAATNVVTKNGYPAEKEFFITYNLNAEQQDAFRDAVMQYISEHSTSQEA